MKRPDFGQSNLTGSDLIMEIMEQSDAKLIQMCRSILIHGLIAPLPTGILYFPQFSPPLRNQDGDPLELNDRPLQLPRKIGDCEQSSSYLV